METAKDLVLPQGRLLLAVSGGRDSVALLHMVRQSNAIFAVAHCNFHLRPGDCDRDEAFVRQLAYEAGVQCYVAQFDTNAYAAENRLSVEEAARNLRYGFFDDLCAQHGYDYILTAHHRDDSIETFFINLLRGTGIAGLHGIRYLNGRVCRPLLGWSRYDIDDYVSRNQLRYVEDYTNSSLLYRRNQIRHQLLPLLRQLAPSFDNAMQLTMQHLADVEQVYRQSVAGLRQRVVRHCGNGDDYILVSDVEQLEPMNTLLYELLHPYGFTAAVVSDIAGALHSQSGTMFYGGSHCLVVDRGRLLITAVDDRVSECSIRCDELPVGDVPDYRSTATTAYFDAAKLHTPLRLRHWQHSDRFAPYGMNGTKLVSDFFSNLKLSVVEKKRQLLLVDADDQIVWVVGRRTDRRFAVTKQTIAICRVTIEGIK